MNRDEVPFSIAGIIEIASGFALNQADRPIWRVNRVKNEEIDKVAEWLTTE